MNKVCSGCGEMRDTEEDFSWKYKAKGIRQRWCKYCQAEANRKHYQNNKEIYLECAITRNAIVNGENKRKLRAYLLEHPCVDCGLADIRCLEFDHVRGGKMANIGELLARAAPWAAIETEIAKCEVRCANCHRVKTLERGHWWRSAQSED